MSLPRFCKCNGGAWRVCSFVLGSLFAYESCLPILQTSELQESTGTLHEELPGPVLVAWVPNPIGKQDLQRFARLLKLSDAQMSFMEIMQQKYQESVQALHRKHGGDLQRLAHAGGKAFSTEHSPQAADLFERFAKLQDIIINEIVQLDKGFFEQIETTLAPEQMEGMWRVLRTRERDRCLPLNDLFPAAQLDLTLLIDQLNLQESARENIEPLLVEYEIRVTPLFVQLRQEISRLAVEKTWAVVHARYDVDGTLLVQGSPLAKHKAREYLDWSRTALARKARLMSDIAQVNDQCAELMVGALPTQVADKFHRDYLSRAYRPVYPDPVDATELYLALVASPGLEAALLKEIQELWRVSREQYDSISQRMEDAYTEWCIETIKTERQSGFPEYQEKMRNWRTERWLLTDSFLQIIETTFASALSAEVLESVRIHRVQIALWQQLATSENSYPR